MHRLTIHQDSDASRQAILGVAVLSLSSVVVGLVYIGSTIPDFISRMHLYINPDAARICAVARNNFVPCISALGITGFCTCLYVALRRRPGQNDDSKPGLNEASHWSYLIHTIVLAFICVMGIISKPIAIDPEPGLMIELTSNPSVSAVNSNSRRVATNEPQPVRYRRVSTSSRRAPTSVATVSVRHSQTQSQTRPSIVKASKPAIEAAVAQAVQPELSIPPPPPVVFLRPSAPMPQIECKLESPPDEGSDRNEAESPDTETEMNSDVSDETSTVMCFDPRSTLIRQFPSGEAYGVMGIHSLRDDMSESSIAEQPLMLQGSAPVKFAMPEPDMVHDISLSGGALPMLARRRDGESLSMLPPSPHRVGYTRDFSDMARPDVPLRTTCDDHASCSGPPPRDSDAHPLGRYMADMQRRIKRAWFPPKDAPAPIVIHFRVARNGEVSKVRVHKTSGSEIGDRAAIRAIENAAPFRPVMQGSPESLDFEFKFDYYSTRLSSILESRSNSPKHAANLGAPCCAYMSGVQRRIRSMWLPPSGSLKPVVVRFQIFSNGELNFAEIARSSGDRKSDQAGLDALKNAAPFTVPEGSSDNPIDMEFAFSHSGEEPASETVYDKSDDLPDVQKSRKRSKRLLWAR